VVDDRFIPMPRSNVPVALIKSEAGIRDLALVRDYGSPHDVILDDTATVDLADGNVFYSIPRCDLTERPSCDAPPKLAYFTNDAWEVSLNPRHTGRALRELFDLSTEVELLRDYESPHDIPIGLDDVANFSDGPVFRTRAAQLHIFVNSLPFTEADGVKPKMTGREIAGLVHQDANQSDIKKLEGDSKHVIGPDEVVEIKNCDRFEVIRRNVTAGFEIARVERELALLRKGGARITIIAEPVPAVIYHDLAVHSGQPVATTDVLVTIPSGYPGGRLDNACLPVGSPVMNILPGAVQHVVTAALGRTWQQKSVHPHNAPGSQWDKNRHGFHTYYGEMLAWVNSRQ
jgi:hypothetical protein